MKSNFSSAHYQERKVYGKLLISRVRMCNFTRLGPRTKKFWLSRVQKFTFSIYGPARTLSGQPGLGPTQKGVNCNFSSPELDRPHIVESSRFRKLKYAVSAGLAKDKKTIAHLIFCLKTEKFRSTKLYGAPLEGSYIFLYRSSLVRKLLELLHQVG